MRILLTGATGQVGRDLLVALQPLGDVTAPTHGELDLEEPDKVALLVRSLRPDLIVNPAGYTNVDRAEHEPARAMSLNRDVPRLLSELGTEVGAGIVHFSTDYVFDGTLGRPYAEPDATNPLSVYGHTKRDGEIAVASATDSYLILRTCWVYSDHGSNFLSRMLRSLHSGQPVDVVADQFGSPTWSAALARSAASALGSIGVEKGDVAERIREVSGIYHMAGEGGGSRYDFARAAIAMTNSQSVVRPVEHAPLPGEAPRPRDSRLSSRHVAETFSVHLGHWREQLAQCLGVGSERVQRDDDN